MWWWCRVQVVSTRAFEYLKSDTSTNCHILRTVSGASSSYPGSKQKREICGIKEDRSGQVRRSAARVQHSIISEFNTPNRQRRTLNRLYLSAWKELHPVRSSRIIRRHNYHNSWTKNSKWGARNVQVMC